MIDKGSCDKGFIWNPSNCECECDTSCDATEYEDYENCKCRKKLADLHHIFFFVFYNKHWDCYLFCLLQNTYIMIKKSS